MLAGEGTPSQQGLPGDSAESVPAARTATVGNVSFHEAMAQRLVSQLKAGTAPWQRPWKPGQPAMLLPVNPVTGKRYKGMNAIALMSQARTDPRWMTYRQAQSIGAQVRRGERGTAIQFWKFSEEHVQTDASGKPVLDQEGKPVRTAIALERPKMMLATVFNAEQVEGLPPMQVAATLAWNAIERAEQLLQASGADIRHGEQDRAFYLPSADRIHLPAREQFTQASGYYATALHEIAHWTGHATRLGRDLSHPFGSSGYAREELRAEIASMILGDVLGIGHDTGRHAAYVGAWIQLLENDPLEIFRAAADAEKIHDYVLGLQPQLVSDQSQKTGAAIGGTGTLQEEERMKPDKLERETDDVPTDAGTLLEPDQRVDVKAEASASILAPGGMPPTGKVVAVAQDPSIRREMHQSEQQGSDAAVPDLSVRRYLDVPFEQKEMVKALGARWDRQERCWYVPQGADAAPFSQWLLPPEPLQSASAEVRAKVYLAVPYEDRLAAKQAGAIWDNAARSWYAPPMADLSALQKWRVDGRSDRLAPAMDPRDEFASLLRSLGCIVSGAHPVMDGKTHRISVEGERHSERSGAGFYVAHLDGHPAGYVKNNKTGLEARWRAKGYFLDERQRAQLQAEAAGKLRAREAALLGRQEQAAARVVRKLAALQPVIERTPYLSAKGIDPVHGIYTDPQGSTTYIPATDVHGTIWTMQTIREDGSKRFAKDGRKEGCFHVVGGFEKLETAPALVISEGFATACTLKQALNFATVAAFDAGNLLSVALALSQHYPDKPLIIAGDNDVHLERTQGVNPGRSKAEEAAKQTAATLLLPVFAPGEQTSRPKDFTDFNDVANRSILGIEGVMRQACAVVNQVIERQMPQPVNQPALAVRLPQRCWRG